MSESDARLAPPRGTLPEASPGTPPGRPSGTNSETPILAGFNTIMTPDLDGDLPSKRAMSGRAGLDQVVGP